MDDLAARKAYRLTPEHRYLTVAHVEHAWSDVQVLTCQQLYQAALIANGDPSHYMRRQLLNILERAVQKQLSIISYRMWWFHQPSTYPRCPRGIRIDEDSLIEVGASDLRQVAQKITDGLDRQFMLRIQAVGIPMITFEEFNL